MLTWYLSKRYCPFVEKITWRESLPIRYYVTFLLLFLIFACQLMDPKQERSIPLVNWRWIFVFEAVIYLINFDVWKLILGEIELLLSRFCIYLGVFLICVRSYLQDRILITYLAVEETVVYNFGTCFNLLVRPICKGRDATLFIHW